MHTGLFADTNLVPDGMHCISFRHGPHGEKVISPIRQPVSIILLRFQPQKEWTGCDAHLEFCTFETRFRFAREPISLFTPPFRRPDI